MRILKMITLKTKESYSIEIFFPKQNSLVMMKDSPVLNTDHAYEIYLAVSLL